jgi:RAT1-interacting protein
MSFEMLEDEVGFITNIDISETVIEQMRDRFRGESRLAWHSMDCRQLSEFPANHFDAVIEKGTVDALCCGDAGPDSIHAIMTEVLRVLRQGCWFISICYGAPELRLSHFHGTDLRWIVRTPIQIPMTVVPGAFYHVYLAQKI